MNSLRERRNHPVGERGAWDDIELGWLDTKHARIARRWHEPQRRLGKCSDRSVTLRRRKKPWTVMIVVVRAE